MSDRFSFFFVGIAAVVTLLLLWFAASPASAQGSGRAGIYIDGSGSMKGFFDSGAVIEINTKLYDVFSSLHLVPTSQVFISPRGGKTSVQGIEPFIARPSWGAETRLDEALGLAGEKEIIALVTDNVQDAGESAQTSTRVFYQGLESAQIESVLLCPYQAPFNGPLYFYKQRFPDKAKLAANLRKENPVATFTEPQGQSQTYHIFGMNGPRALAIYIIVRSPFQFGHIPGLIQKIEDKFGSGQVLMVKPVDQGKFSLAGVNTRKEVETSFESMRRLCPDYENSRVMIEAPNLRLISPTTPLFRVQRTSEEGKYQLKPLFPKAIIADRGMLFRFYLKLANVSETLLLGKPDGECARKVTIELKDAKFEIPTRFEDCFVVPEVPLQSLILPGFIPNMVSKKNEEHLNACFPFVAGAEIRIPPIRFKATLSNVIRLLTTWEIPCRVEGRIQILVPSGYFLLDPQYNSKHFTHSLVEQARLYSPEDIVSYINLKPYSLDFEFLSKDLNLSAPTWIILVFITLVVAVVLSLLFLMYCLTRVLYLRFDDTGETVAVSLPVPFTHKVYRRNDIEILFFFRRLLAIRTYPAPSVQLEDIEGEPLPYTTASQREFKIVTEGRRVSVDFVPYSVHSESSLSSSASRRLKSDSERRSWWRIILKKQVKEKKSDDFYSD